MKIAIVKYNAGNIQSVTYALNRLGIEPILTNDPEELSKADKVIFPGVGEAGSAMKSIKESNLDLIIPNLKQPVLGICVGLQLLCDYSEEGDTTCLGVFKGIKVKKFPVLNTDNESFKVPQMGWNKLFDLKTQLFDDITAENYVYYVHSFAAEINPEFTIAKTSYSIEYSAALHHKNFYAVQFHPEKSSDTGSLLLKNFIEKC